MSLICITSPLKHQSRIADLLSKKEFKVIRMSEDKELRYLILDSTAHISLQILTEALKAYSEITIRTVTDQDECCPG